MNFIKKINKYLLEHYPLVWNTRLVWMLLINLIMHLSFFIMGYLAVSDMSDLKNRYQLSSYYYDTVIMNYNILFSILILLIWIVFYLRNNAFKNFYKLSSLALFKEFCIILLIGFISISQYLSFKQGLMIKIRGMYEWEQVDQDIKAFNRTAIFLPQTYSNYEIDKKKYPEPFPLKMVSENENDPVQVIDTTRAYFNYKGFRYQFFEIDEKYLQKYRENYQTIYYPSKYSFKHRIVKDVSDFKDHIRPNLRNYSDKKFPIGQDSLDYVLQLRSHESILNEADSIKIKRELQTFLELLKTYEIDHNVTMDYWFPLVYNPPLYEINEFVQRSNPAKTPDYSYIDSYMDNDDDKYVSGIPFSKTVYCDLSDVDNLFKNVHDSYFVESETEFISVVLALAIFFGLILYIFKTTSLRSLLLSIVSFIVIMVLVIMMMSYSNRIYDYQSNVEPEQLIMIGITFLVMFFAVLSYMRKVKKLITSILFSLSVYALPLFTLFVCLRISKMIKDANEGVREGFALWFDDYGYWLIVSIWILGIFVYSRFIKELNSRPE